MLNSMTTILNGLRVWCDSYSVKVIWTNPLLQLLLSYASLTVSIAYVPSNPIIRLGAFCTVLAFTIPGLLYKDQTHTGAALIEFCVECTCGVILYANHFLLLMRVTPPPGYGLVKRLLWAVNLVLNPRGIGTTWQIRNLTWFSVLPSRRRFIIQRFFSSIQFYFMWKAFEIINRRFYIENLQYGDYSEYKESIIRRIGDVSMHELFIRSWLPLQTFFGFWSQSQFLHSVVSVFAVAFGDKPQRWPPLYGYVRDAYSLRRFWGLFWQQLLRSAYLSNASFIAQRFFLIPKSSPIYRGIITILVFGLTGCAHAAGLWKVNPTCDTLPVLRWYLLMGVAILFEDLIQRLYWWIRSGQKEMDRLAMSRWWRILGYIWVWVYLGWSLPKMFFPLVDCRVWVQGTGHCPFAE